MYLVIKMITIRTSQITTKEIEFLHKLLLSGVEHLKMRCCTDGCTNCGACDYKRVCYNLQLNIEYLNRELNMRGSNEPI